MAAEPPPPANYLPPNQQQQPSNQYGAPAPSGFSGQPQQPSNQYGAPPSNQYIPPQNSYIPPQQQQQQPQKPSQSYGAPSQTSAVYQQAPQQPQAAYGAPNAGAGGYGGGGNNQYESNEPARYNFEYNVQDYQSGNDFGHMEQRDGDLTTGRYYVLLPDGRKQVVNYEADRNGYRPTITYEQTQQQGGGVGGAGGGYNANAQPSHGAGNGQFGGY